METHDQDPTTHGDADPWHTVQDEFGDLSQRLKETYQKVASDRGPSEEEIKQAFGTLVGAWDQVAESVSSALQDPEVRHHLKAAASSLAAALGDTISELGNELRGDRRATNSAEASDENEEE